MLSRKNAIKEGLRGLKHGAFLGIVGDQGMPDSGFSSPFFGRTAWTSPVPAMLSYRTGSPLIVATTRRDKGRYVIHYSDPIWPHPELPMDPEVNRMMREALHYLEEGIRKAPGQWLWTHNRWKQQTPERLKRQFRHESMLIILPRECDAILPHLATFRELYPREFITVMAPVRHQVTLQDAEIIPYTTDDELFIRDYRFKLVFNFTSEKKLNSHFKKLAAFHVATLEDFPGENLSSQLKQGVLRAGV
jgi:KDO2-lipid IV(A) lauroyltransferase